MKMDTLLQDGDAMALGASAVFVGKAVTAGLATGGTEGVRVVLEGIIEELRSAMSLTGAKEIKDVDSMVLWRDQIDAAPHHPLVPCFSTRSRYSRR